MMTMKEDLRPEASAVTFIGTSNRGFAAYAMEELRRMFADIKITIVVPAEIFECLVNGAGELEDVMRKIVDEKPVFLRHVQPVEAEFEMADGQLDMSMVEAWLQAQTATLRTGEKAAVHIRKKEGAAPGLEGYACRKRLEQVLAETYGIAPVSRDADHIVSLYVSRAKAYIGIAAPELQLSDWPGGMVRFQREEEQISRAKFKLLEAEREFGLTWSDFRHALDIGAAPGGWTSLLLERGLKVTAVDPGDMHSSLLANPNLTYHRKNAGDVKFAPETFDLLVCDMSWSPRQMEKLVLELLPALQSGGTAVITIKLMHKKPFQTIKELRSAFGEVLDIRRMKQLFHNREEFTLYGVKK